MPNLTLASAPVSNADQLVIALVMPPDAPPSFCFAGRAGGAPSVSDPRRFRAPAAAVIAIMDGADRARGGRAVALLDPANARHQQSPGVSRGSACGPYRSIRQIQGARAVLAVRPPDRSRCER